MHKQDLVLNNGQGAEPKYGIIFRTSFKSLISPILKKY